MAHPVDFHRKVTALLPKVACYPDTERVREDICALKGHRALLVPRLGVLARGSGAQSTLIFLNGTIPIVYEEREYNIPVNVWLTEAYPITAPICYIAPTRDMTIAPQHPNVNVHGYCQFPLLQTWTCENNLLQLVEHMAEVFHENSPVYHENPGGKRSVEDREQEIAENARLRTILLNVTKEKTHLERAIQDEQQTAEAIQHELAHVKGETLHTLTPDQLEALAREQEGILKKIAEEKIKREYQAHLESVERRIAEVNQEIETLRSRKLCPICAYHTINIVLLPCRHNCVCFACSEKLQECPLCRTPIMERLHVYGV